MWEPLKEKKGWLECTTREFCWRGMAGQTGRDSLESKSAAVTSPSGLKTSLFEGRAADQQELVGGVHELQLL